MPSYNGFDYSIHVCIDGKKYQPRPWGVETLVVATDNKTKTIHSITITTKKPPAQIDLQKAIEDSLDKMRGMVDFEKYRDDNLVDGSNEMRDDYENALTWAIKYLRENPDLSEDDAIKDFDVAFKDSAFSGKKLFGYLMKRIGSDFDGLKIYLSEKKFDLTDQVEINRKGINQ